MKTLANSIVVLLMVCSGSSWAATDQTTQLEFFESRIRPVLIKHCYECHSVESGKSKGGLYLDSRAGWQIGGDSGASIVPNKPGESLLIEAITRTGKTPEMPPKSHLPPQVINDFKKWIADGAMDPRDGTPPIHEDKAISIEEGRKFWAFQPRKTFTQDHSIDEFVQPQAPHAPADQLVRRLFLDLIGLPPTLDERNEFLRLYREQSPKEAVSTFTNQLLTRKAFGEKWARHWLDIARYADSNGGDFNLTYHQAWRYRNYVIDAFNNDMPYAQFIREQIAGDLLPYDSPEQRNRQLIATGYLMVAPKMLTERNKPKMHLDIADEQLDTIGKSIMGLSLGCARCHDHKFDPIPTADYYAMAGILHSTRTANGFLMGNVNVSGWAETDLAHDEQTEALIEAGQSKAKKLEQEIKRLKAEEASRELAGIVIDDTDAEVSGPWRKSTFRPNHVGTHYLALDKGKGPYSITWKAELPKPGKYELRVSFGGGSGLAKTAQYAIRHGEGETQLVIDQTTQPTIRGLWFSLGQFEFRPPSDQQSKPAIAEVRLAGKNAGDGAVVADAIQFIHIDDLDKDTPDSKPSLAAEIKALEQELKQLKENAPKPAKAMAAADHTNDRLGDLHIRIRGEPKNLGPQAPRGFLQVADYEGAKKPTISEGESGRLELAEWLTHPNHPLTARVMVNRIWQQLFGRGLVATADNFGLLSTPPSHPELIDYLTEKFVANNWSTKYLIQEIVSSKTYQQAARTPSDDDPNNERLRHQNIRPAPAETLRDSILAIAGELDREPRESVVKPLGMYAIATSGNRHASLGQTGKLRQRSIYMPIVRGAVPPSLAVFDLPNPDLVTGTRSVTTVPAQALFMMNSPFARDMAQALSTRFSADDLSISDIVRQLYQRILIRDADTDDIAMAKEYITGLIDAGKSQQEAIASFVQILFCSAEFRMIE